MTTTEPRTTARISRPRKHLAPPLVVELDCAEHGRYVRPITSTRFGECPTCTYTNAMLTQLDTLIDLVRPYGEYTNTELRTIHAEITADLAAGTLEAGEHEQAMITLDGVTDEITHRNLTI